MRLRALGALGALTPEPRILRNARHAYSFIFFFFKLIALRYRSIAIIVSKRTAEVVKKHFTIRGKSTVARRKSRFWIPETPCLGGAGHGGTAVLGTTGKRNPGL